MSDTSLKQKYKVIRSEDIDYNDSDKVLQPKIDGASSIIKLYSDKPNRIFSTRTSKKSGKLIEHTDQLPDIRDLEIPKSLDNTVLRSEVYGKTDHTPMSAHQIGGILNSNLEESLKKQKEQGWLKPYIYDIIKYNNQTVKNGPYQLKLDLMRKITDSVPELKSAETAFTADQKRDLVKRIKDKEHPDTQEGVVQWDLNKPTGAPAKLKFRDNWDVVVRSIIPAVDKYGKVKREAGAFEYSWTPKGKIVGNVGTGFDRETKIDMLNNPENYIGHVARVKSSQKYSSGALRAPAFYTMDIEKNLEKKSSFLNPIERAVFQMYYNNGLQNELDKIASGKKTIVILARHGETKLNKEGDKIRGWKNIPLDETGHKEAKIMADKLAKEKVDVIMSSDLDRASDTAKALSDKIKKPVEKTKSLRPWHLGEYAGQHSKDVLNIIEDFARKYPNKPVDGGESFNNFKNRYLNFLKNIRNKYKGKTVALFTHHRNDRLLSAWEQEGTPDNKKIDLNKFLVKGIKPGEYRKVEL